MNTRLTNSFKRSKTPEEFARPLRIPPAVFREKMEALERRQNEMLDLIPVTTAAVSRRQRFLFGGRKFQKRSMLTRNQREILAPSGRYSPVLTPGDGYRVAPPIAGAVAPIRKS